MQGHLTRDLAGVVLSPAQWRSTSLPATLSERELEKLVGTCDGRGGRASPLELRDRAILLCLVDLGSRSSDVAALRVGGVDLVAGPLTLHQPKRRSSSVLPMTRRLSQAIRRVFTHAAIHHSKCLARLGLLVREASGAFPVSPSTRRHPQRGVSTGSYGRLAGSDHRHSRDPPLCRQRAPAKRRVDEADCRSAGPSQHRHHQHLREG